MNIKGFLVTGPSCSCSGLCRCVKPTDRLSVSQGCTSLPMLNQWICLSALWAPQPAVSGEAQRVSTVSSACGGTRLVQGVGEDRKGVPRCPYGKQCQMLSATRPGRPVIASSFAAELDSLESGIGLGEGGWEEENDKNEDCSLGVGGPV